MAYVLADNIITPLGGTTQAVCQALADGRTALQRYDAARLHVPEPYVAALLTDGQVACCAEAGTDAASRADVSGLSRFEQMALASARRALNEARIDAGADDVVLILASTKGSVEQMLRHDDAYPLLGDSARRIARCLGIHTEPIVVCNACISGVAALVLAQRLLQWRYRYAVVCGADSPARFVISGFQSLKALSADPCRPFDMERCGLNLGEAAATLVLARQPRPDTRWMLTRGAVKNDAYHISAPSKTAEGLRCALQHTLQGTNTADLALVNAHGTATLFNDQMESVAIARAGLSAVPANALKGYFGHTLGAAGVMETILCMHHLDEGTIVGTRGFGERGVSGEVNIAAANRTTRKHRFVKLISGFGGCNATILGTHVADGGHEQEPPAPFCRQPLRCSHRVTITPQGAVVDGTPLALPADADGHDLLTRIYRHCIADYPKYYKMDALSRLGFVASELLLQAEGAPRSHDGRTDRAVLLFNRTSSVQADRKYLESIEDADNCFPSPSVFVYTLPNIVAGEIAIRNGYRGETAFYILPEKNAQQMDDIMQASLQDTDTQSLLAGWVDYAAPADYEATLAIYERQPADGRHTPQTP